MGANNNLRALFEKSGFYIVEDFDQFNFIIFIRVLAEREFGVVNEIVPTIARSNFRDFNAEATDVDANADHEFLPPLRSNFSSGTSQSARAEMRHGRDVC